MKEIGRVIGTGQGTATVAVMRTTSYDGKLGSEPAPDSPFTLTVRDPFGVSRGVRVEVAIDPLIFIGHVVAAFVLPIVIPGLTYWFVAHILPNPAVLGLSAFGLLGAFLGLVTAIVLLVRLEQKAKTNVIIEITRVLNE
jgi:hypothetical protein